MPKFATAQNTAKTTAPIETTDVPVYTHTGGVGVRRTPESDLFVLAASNFVKEDSFHELAADRDNRFIGLVHTVTRSNPEWIQKFVPYLRGTLNMRSASIVVAAEYVKAGGENGRAVVASAILRADEPAEMLAYWHAAHGRKVPKAVKRGVADAVQRVYSENSLLRYDGTGRAWRFGDVIEIVHPKAKDEAQSALFKYALDRRRHSPDVPSALAQVTADAELMSLPDEMRRGAINTPLFEIAGWSWERLAGWLPGGMDKEAWEAVIPNMGYMALIRNLRNFDNAGVSDEVAEKVCAKIADPDEVARSRQFPFRLHSAFVNAPSLRWAGSLEKAIDLSLANVPSLSGRTLILLDLSGSMFFTHSMKGSVTLATTAGLFAYALAKRAESATLVGYGSDSQVLDHKRPLLLSVENLPNLGGTYTMGAFRQHYLDHDRVVIVTDEQAHDAGSSKPAMHPGARTFTFNLAGYRPALLDANEDGNYAIGGGLTDQSFRLIPLLERSRSADWDRLFAGAE